YVSTLGLSTLAPLSFPGGGGGGAGVNGVLLLGKDGNAHELGHAVIDFKSSRRCGCGGVGHLEAYVGGAHMSRLYRETYGVELKPAEIFEKYRAGSVEAREFLDMWLDALAAGVATVIAAYDPELLAVGGSIALHNWDVVGVELEKRLGKYLGVRKPEVRQASFGDDEVAIGAAALAFRTPETLKKFGYPR
ncbi:MAG: ROK family protein, partial [Pyrobaculum sp.]